MRVAAIDIGSNTIRLLVADLTGAGFRGHRHERMVTRLASGMHESGFISRSALRHTVDTVRDFVEMARKDGAALIRAAATSALREAANAPGAIQEIEDASGVEVSIVSGNEEARIMSMGALREFPPEGSYLVFDLGGGSTEFVLCEQGRLTDIISIPMGVVKLLEKNIRNDPPSDGDLRGLDMQTSIMAEEAGLALGPGIPDGCVLVGTAGTATTLASLDLGLIKYDAGRVQGHVISIGAIRELERTMQSLPASRRRELRGMEPERADLILAGARVTLRVMESLGFESLTVSDHGFLEGLVVDLLHAH